MAYGIVLLSTACKDDRKQATLPAGVSIIICAKNEAANLERMLPLILSQEAPGLDWEVLVVNDRSTDDTAGVLQRFSTHPRLRVVTTVEDSASNLPGKKHAMQQGVVAASFLHILTTDADCTPAGRQWLAQMTAGLGRADAVIGFGRLRSRGGLLGGFIQGETLHAFMLSSASARLRMPTSGVGRNMAFRKALYAQARVEGFDKIPSGDDDLLLHSNPQPRVAVRTHAESHTVSNAPQTLKAYIRQKKRHLSTGKYYRPLPKLALGLYAGSQVLFWIAFLFLLFLVKGWWREVVILLLIARLALFETLWSVCSRRLFIRQPGTFLAFDVRWLLYNLFFAPYILWKNQQDWK